MEAVEEKEGPIFRDIRRYYCDYCGLSRSKKSLITSHLLSHHQDEMKEKIATGDEKKERITLNKCEECSASFHKPAHLRQHMQSHSIERPFSCTVDDCHCSYRRKDHLTRHLLQHQGKLFDCPVENCPRKFAFQGNVKRHVKELHGEEASSSGVDDQLQFVCSEIGCAKVFKYASKLQKHEASHVKLDTVETFCLEPGCMKYFTNEQCLKAHLQSCHQHIICKICETKQLKKNIKRHLRTHEARGLLERIKCNFKGCLHTFSTRSNLQKHVKAVHVALKPFSCSVPGCDMRFSYKHVRDNHEKSWCHFYTEGDFEESDEQVRMRPRGGRKRKCPTIESLVKKRVLPPNLSDSLLTREPEYISWLLSTEANDHSC